MTYTEHQQANPFQTGQAPGQAAFGQPYGTQGWGQQRQLSQQDVNEVVRQLVPMLPHVLAQAQQAQYQPQAAFGFGPQRQLSPQDINEVVRQILPVLPQIAGLLQQQQQPQYGAMAASQPQQWGQPQQYGQPQFSQPQPQLPQMQAAFGQSGTGQQRQLNQQEVQDVARQLATILPQVLGAIQSPQR